MGGYPWLVVTGKWKSIEVIKRIHRSPLVTLADILLSDFLICSEV